MKPKSLHVKLCASLGVGLYSSLGSMAMAQVIPGPADVGRVLPEQIQPAPDYSKDQETLVPSAVPPPVAAPKGARAIHLTLKAVRIEGAMAFTQAQLADIYAPYIDKDVTLDIAWTIAGEITERYRNAGYFLSHAYVPQQHIKDGTITINVVEGYIGKVELPENLMKYSVIKSYVDRLTAQKPAMSDAVESLLLRLNDLPGLSFRAVLSPLKDKAEDEAAAEMTLIPTTKDGKGLISYDNYSSRYLGPNEVSASYSASVLPLQQTTLTGLTSVPFDKLRYGTIDHSVAVAPDLSLDVNGGLTKAYPDFSLRAFDINSQAATASLGLQYQYIRQRQDDLSFKLSLDSRDVVSDILDAPLTRDSIRALRAGFNFDLTDRWWGYSTASMTLSQGIDALGASQKDAPYLSRAQARPDFDKLEWSLTRLQTLNSVWALQLASAGQLASGTLYSSEQFGYGGQAFGRAYDTSEITGDSGVNGSLELRFTGFSEMQPVGFQPYSFYDAGQVWNDAIGQPKRESGSSAGLGIRGNAPWGLSGNMGLAWPLTRQIETPIYGDNKNGPRFFLQVSKVF